MSTIADAQKSFLPAGDAAWLATGQEDVIDAALPIIDPHHHLWGPPRSQYLGGEFAADMNAGHNIVGTVFADCSEGYRTDGPEEYKPVGETEFACRVGEASERGDYGAGTICQGIISRVDLGLGAAAEDILKAHIAAGKGRFKGIRFSTAADPNPEIRSTARVPPLGLLREEKVHEGVAVMKPLGLVLDLWLYFHQLDDVCLLAEKFPDTPLVLDHLGGPILSGPYAGRHDEVYATWLANVTKVARYPNVTVKVGGLGMKLLGFHFEDKPKAPSSAELAAAWKPFVEPCLELFGADRAMFESNFPVDSLSCSYANLWNAFKRLAEGASAEDRTALFAGTAKRVYSLDQVGLS